MGTCLCKFNGDRVTWALKEMYYIPLFQVNIKGHSPIIVYSFTTSSYPFEIKINNWYSKSRGGNISSLGNNLKFNKLPI